MRRAKQNTIQTYPIVNPPIDWSQDIVAAQGSNIATILADPPLIYNNATGELAVLPAAIATAGIISIGSQTMSGAKTFDSGAFSGHLASTNDAELCTLAVVRNLVQNTLLPSQGVVSFTNLQITPSPLNDGDRFIQTITAAGYIANDIYTYIAAGPYFSHEVPTPGIIV